LPIWTVGSVFETDSTLIIHFFDVQPFIVTLAGMFFARGLCFMSSVESVSITDPTFRAMAMGTVTLGQGVVLTYSVLIALVVVLVAAYVLHLTRFGRTVYAVGGSQS